MPKHLPYVSGRYVAVGVEEILDVYLLGDPMYEPGQEDGKADWVMIGEAPGIVLKYPWPRRTSRILRSVGLSVYIVQTLESRSATENG